ncbi:hypothetical protein CBL_01424 [Carabus blaptoides fortunei]
MLCMVTWGTRRCYPSANQCTSVLEDDVPKDSWCLGEDGSHVLSPRKLLNYFVLPIERCLILHTPHHPAAASSIVPFAHHTSPPYFIIFDLLLAQAILGHRQSIVGYRVYQRVMSEYRAGSGRWRGGVCLADTSTLRDQAKLTERLKDYRNTVVDSTCAKLPYTSQLLLERRITRESIYFSIGSDTLHPATKYTAAMWHSGGGRGVFLIRNLERTHLYSSRAVNAGWLYRGTGGVERANNYNRNRKHVTLLDIVFLFNTNV